MATAGTFYLQKGTFSVFLRQRIEKKRFPGKCSRSPLIFPDAFSILMSVKVDIMLERAADTERKFLMSANPRNINDTLKKVLKVMYWVLFGLSLAIVVAYFAFRIAAKPPEVGGEVTFPPQSETSLPPEQTGEPVPTEPAIVLTRREGVYTCLIMGSDDGNGLADTIMIGVFDTRNRTADLISVPRDTLVSVNGRDRKINSVYGVGGVELLRDTLEDALAIPLDFYVEVELDAFAAIVDEIGGVWFDVPMDMDYEDPYQDLVIHVEQGYQLLDGEKAMGVMRFRSGYASQDIGRTQTQRAFLTAMVKQTVTLSNATKVRSLIQILNDYVYSDMPLDNMLYFATHAIGMDLDTALSSTILPNEWKAPYVELVDSDVLELVNGLGIYEETVPAEALHICHK